MSIGLWKFLNTDIRELFSLGTVDGTIETADATFKLAETLQEQEIQDIAPWLEQGASLMDILVTPEAELVESVLPFAKVATGLLKYYLKKTKEVPAFPEVVMLTCFKAYSESLTEFIRSLKEPTQSESLDTSKVDFSDLEIDERDANRALVCFQRSKIAIFLQDLLSERLNSLGIPYEEANLLTLRAVWNTHRYITKVWAGLPDDVKQLGSISLSEWRKEQEKYESIDTYLKEYISPNPTDFVRKQRWQVFNEPFTFKEIYVPLKAQPLNCNGETDKNQKPVLLEEWTKVHLNDPKKQHQVRAISF